MLNKKKGDNSSAEDVGMTVRQRLRQKRELEEKRKFGLAPLAVDDVTGNEISPNVPQLISQAPWYYGVSGPTLDHQRQKHADAMDTLQDQQDTVVVLGKGKAYAPGACGNCGSSTHKTADCYKPRKKVGAMYSGKVTGIDMRVERAEKSYAQKRDRYAMGAGVDLLQQAPQEEEEGQETGDGGGEKRERKGDHDVGGGAIKKDPHLSHVFATQTAVTGGAVEIKELPKHLQNLDDDGVLFDPKTGSMRGNPNAADPTRIFQGDLQRYRSGDYYTYLEMQLRFLNGESKSFVDFKLDEELQKTKRQQQEREGNGNSSGDNAQSGGSTEEESVRDRLVRSLYGESTLASTENLARMREALASVAAASSSPSVPSAKTAGHPRMGPATRNGHACVYGSYFDRDTFQWGYKCCKRLGKDAAACHSTPASATTHETTEVLSPT